MIAEFPLHEIKQLHTCRWSVIKGVVELHVEARLTSRALLGQHCTVEGEKRSTKCLSDGDLD